MKKQTDQSITYLSILYIFLCCASFLDSYQVPYKAVINTAVVDMNNSFPPPLKDTPIAPGSIQNCNRSYQGLFNQIVECIEERGDAVKVTIENVKYNKSTQPNSNSFWIQKENIIPIDTLTTPTAIPAMQYGIEPTIVLTYPWNGFSVGTRFKHVPQCDTREGYAVTFMNFSENSLNQGCIPRNNAMQEFKHSAKSQRKLFITNLNTFLDRVTKESPEQVIGYVWGGSSFIHGYETASAYQKNNAWYRKGNNHPYTGFDCSSLVMRMAQIAGINFPWKTTAVIELAQAKLTTNDILQEGDLIWIQGHVMIISNLARNEFIEARGYKSGYGKLHRIALSNAFEDITTYDELRAHYQANKPLRLKNAQGSFYMEAPFKLLKLL